jgi:hypothetical protein
MKVRCSKCFGLLESKDFKYHMKYVHHIQTADIIFSCPEEGCTRAFDNLHSLRKHAVCHERIAEEQHIPIADETTCTLELFPRNSEVDDENVTHSDLWPYLPADSSDEDFTAPIICGSSNLFEYALNVVSTFYSDSSLSRVQVERIIHKFDGFLKCDWFDNFRDLVLTSTNEISKEQIFDKFKELQSVFSTIDSDHKRLKELQSRGFYIKPEEVIFGFKEEKNRLGLLENIKHTGQFIPLRAVLKIFFEIPNVFQETIDYISLLESAQDPKVSNIIQTVYWKNKSSNADKIILPLFLYQDDFEPGNPLGSHATIYKMSGVYVSLPCLPPKYASKLCNIFLLQISHSDDAKDFDKSCIYGRIIDELNYLATKGIQISIRGQPVILYFKLAMIIGDNLGLNTILGFTESFSATKFCRICQITKTKSKSLYVEDSRLLRNTLNYESDVSKNDQTSTGIKEDSIWNKVIDFHVTENYCVDGMHDQLHGTANFGMSRVLYNLIYVEKLFDLQTLNFKIQYYKYPWGSNKPPLITADNLKKFNLKMSASEMLTFVMHAGLIFGNLIPEGNKHWELFKLIRQILVLTLKTNIVEESCEVLRILIKKHHQLYVKLFNEDLKPKHHIMLHYPRFMKIIGPLRHIWAMRYEGKHQKFKQMAKVSYNRKNLCYTLATKNQLYMSYIFSNQTPFEDSVVYKTQSKQPRVCLPVEIDSSVFNNNYQQIKYVTVCNRKYQVDTTIIIKLNGIPVFGIIKNIFTNIREGIKPTEKNFAIFVTVLQTQRKVDHLQAYQVKETTDSELLQLMSISQFDLPHMKLHVDGKLYVCYD